MYIIKVNLNFKRLRWDYLIPDDTDYESQAHTQNPKLKAFNWIKRHGTTMKQVLMPFVDSTLFILNPGGSCFPTL